MRATEGLNSVMINKLTKLFCFGLALTVSSSFASVIVAGQTSAPDVFTTNAMSIIAGASYNVNPTPGTSFNATYNTYVARDPNNVFCANCLDFLIQVSNAGPGIIERVSTSAFDSYLTDVGYNTAFAGGGTIAPTTVDRSTNGSVIGFNFIPPGTAISTGQTSYMLEIMTNATNYAPGFVSIQDGQAGTDPGFQPAASTTPEPVSMSLLGGGLALLGLARWRRTSK